VASCWLSLLLALKIAGAGRAAANQHGAALIRRMSVENVLWGAPRIQGELLKLGFTVAQSTVAKYMAKKDDPSGQSWGTFLRNHAPQIAAMDLFVVPTISFVQLGDCPAGSARACFDQCHETPNGGMDRAADHRSVSVE
jgi:hypothetical protein